MVLTARTGSKVGEPAYRLTSNPSTVSADGMVRKFADEWCLVTGAKVHEVGYDNGNFMSGHCLSNVEVRVVSFIAPHGGFVLIFPSPNQSGKPWRASPMCLMSIAMRTKLFSQNMLL